jgi:N utilization substance protein A
LERDRGVNREIIIQAIESAIHQAARKSMEVSNDLRIEIDRKTFALKAFDPALVSDEDTGLGFVSLRKARTIKKEAKIGETIDVEIPPAKLGRIAAQTARQMILQKIREAERKNVYDEYKDRIGDIIRSRIAISLLI